MCCNEFCNKFRNVCIHKETPIYGMVYRDMTEEEETEYRNQNDIEVDTPKTAEEKIEEQQAVIEMLSELLDTLLTEIIPAMVEGDLK